MRSLRQRTLTDPLEALLVALAFGLFAVLPVDLASALGGLVARAIGPLLPLTKRAGANLRRAFPDIDEVDARRIVRGMWDNLGRTFAEHTHLKRFDPYRENSRVEVVGAEIIDTLRDDGKPGMFFSAHLGNWEIAPLAATRRGLAVHIAYRAANNPLADRLFARHRSALAGTYFPKGAGGARLALRTLRGGGHVALLVDQKMNDGIAVPFLGADAMTAPALAQLALRFDCPVVPIRVERIKGARFRLTIFPPIEHPASGDRQADVAAMMADVNRRLGAWITERPEQWLWLHNRWPV